MMSTKGASRGPPSSHTADPASGSRGFRTLTVTWLSLGWLQEVTNLHGLTAGHPSPSLVSPIPRPPPSPHTSPVSFSRRPRMSSLSFCSLIRHSALWTSRLRSLSGPGEWRLASSSNTRSSFRLLSRAGVAQNSSQPGSLISHAPQLARCLGLATPGGYWLLGHSICAGRGQRGSVRLETIRPQLGRDSGLGTGQSRGLSLS